MSTSRSSLTLRTRCVGDRLASSAGVAYPHPTATDAMPAAAAASMSRTSSPTAATFADDSVKGQARYYLIAVDALGQEGFPSAPAWCNRRLKDLYAPFTGEWHQ